MKVKAIETQDLIKRFENVEAVRRTDLEIKEGDIIVLHNGLPVSPTSTDSAAVNAIETSTSTDGAADALISLEKITKAYDSTTRALNEVTLSFKKNEWTTIMGPSGSGKTTLLNIIGCLDLPTSGIVRIAGKEATGVDQAALTRLRRENVGLVFQQHHLVPYLTALENVMLAQYYRGSPDETKAADALRNVGLGHRLDHPPAHLSGGEQQRVCIARALVNEPAILLADEPTGNLDQASGNVVLQLIQRLHEEGRTIVLVTHNPNISGLGDRTIRLVDGSIEQDSKSGGDRNGE
ncbi:MAG: ABC transporter ATP-binding protein [Halobacteriota archaeon]